MQPIDIIITVLLVVGLISGLRAGFIKQIAGFVGLIGGLFIGRAFYMEVGAWLIASLGMSANTANITAFILILIIVPLLFNVAGWLVAKLLHSVNLGWVNRLLGGLVGVLKCALFIGVVITGIEFFDKNDTFISEPNKKASVFYYPFYEVTGTFFANVKNELIGDSQNI